VEVLSKLDCIKQQINTAIYQAILPHLDGEYADELLCVQIDLVRALQGIKPVAEESPK